MKFLRITSTLLLIAIAVSSFAQVNGNGKLKTIKIEAKQLNKLYADFPIKLILDNSGSAKLEMTADENVFKHIGIKRNGNKLNITQEKWIEPSQMVQVSGSLPLLKWVKMSGYGYADIQNIDSEKFEIILPVGTASLGGLVQQFALSTKNGKIDAQYLHAERVNAKVEGFGKVWVNCTKNLLASATRDGKVLYTGNPENVAKVEREGGIVQDVNSYTEKALPPVEYITIQLKNNQQQKIDAFVSGPEQKRFGYGIPFKAYESRKETWPVGTKLYLGDDRRSSNLIYTVKAEDADKTIELF